MRNLKHLVHGGFGSVLLCLFTVGVFWPAQGQGQQIVIIVNKANNANDLRLDAIRNMFLGDKTSWPDGKHVAVLMRQGGQADRQVILKQIYKMGEAEYNKYFMQAVFTGRISAPPKEVASAAEMKRMVAENPAAIGYLRKDDADDSVKAVLTLP